MTTMTVEPGIKCGRCGTEIYPFPAEPVDKLGARPGKSEGVWYHADVALCFRLTLARARTAEHQLGEVREGLADARETAAVERERVRALEQWVAELEEAARQWRPAPGKE